MIGGEDFLLLRPLWLLTVPAVAVLGLWAARRGRGLGGWEGVIDPALMPALVALGHVVRPVSLTGPLAPVLVAAVLGLALSGPAQRNDDAPSFRNLDGVMLAIDMSPSVTQGGGLDDAQAAAVFIASRAGGRPVGLILFTGESYLVSAMTSDTATLEGPIAVLADGLMPDGGSRPDRALAMAGSVLTKAGIVGGDVVLISDGGGVTDAALTEARRIAQAGARVSTLYVAPEGAPAAMPAPDAAVLDTLAAAGGGVAATALQPGVLAQALRRGHARVLAQSGLAPLLFTDWGRFLVVFALFPALMLFRRRV